MAKKSFRGMLSSIFKSNSVERIKGSSRWTGLTVYEQKFRKYGEQMYSDELIRSAVDARARSVEKLAVQVQGSAKPKLKTRLMSEPNPWQTWPQFHYRTETIRCMHGTAFLVPILDEYDEPIGVYSFAPEDAELREYNGIVYIVYRFRHNQKAAIELSKCHTITRFQFQSDFFGTGNQALRPTAALMDLNKQGIDAAIKNSATYRFMAKATNFSKTKDLASEKENFNAENFSEGKGGAVLLFPNTYQDIKQIISKPYTVDSSMLAQMNTSVFNYFGVNEDVIQNKAYGDTYAAFYENVPEEYSIQLTSALDKIFFTRTERNIGNSIFFSSNKIQFLTQSEKLSYATQLGDRGALMVDEIREVFNLPSLPNGAGQVFMHRGEYKYTDINGNLVSSMNEETTYESGGNNDDSQE